MTGKLKSPGAILVSAREAQGLSPQKVADALHLPLRFVQAMESDDYSKGPQPAFAKGYLRTYAKLLQISGNEVVEAFDALNVTPPEPVVTSAALSKTFYEVSSIHARLRLILLLALLGAGIVLWGYNQYAHFFSLHIKENIEPVLLEMQETQALLPEMSFDVPPFLSNSEKISWPSFVVESLSVFQVMDAMAQEAIEEVTQADVTLSALNMVFDSDCWISVKDNNQKRLVSGLMSEGKNLKLSGVAPFYVVLGKPSAVQVWVNGKAVDTSHYHENEVAKIKVEDDASS